MGSNSLLTLLRSSRDRRVSEVDTEFIGNSAMYYQKNDAGDEFVNLLFAEQEEDSQNYCI